MVPTGGLVEYASWAGLLLALLLSLAVVTRLSDEDSLFSPLHDRFVLGVPWGTVVVILGVLAVYYLLQGGNQDGGPVVAGFRSWSLWYPQGMVFSSFAHASDSHVIGNMLGTVAFAPIVEYAWGHYRVVDGGEDSDAGTAGAEHTDADDEEVSPDGGGSAESPAGESVLATPAARIGLFVGIIVVLGLLNSLFVPGAVIGFSGIVFALAGAAIVTHPLASVGAIVGIQVVSLVRRAVLSPIAGAMAQTRFVSPSWANIALQGHAFGLIIGVLLAGALVRYRERWPQVRYVFFAALVFAVTRSMWAVNWPLGNGRFVLYRGIGTALVFVLAALIAVAVSERDPALIARIDLSARESALGVLLAFMLALSLVGVPYMLVTVSPGAQEANGIEMRDYTVGYAENVENKYVSAVRIPVVRDSLTINQSGVIVTSDERQVWELDTQAGELAQEGKTTVVVGDAAWRETIVVNRTTWELIDGNSTYKVFGRHDGERQRLFVDSPARSSVRINGSRIQIEPSRNFYNVVVIRDKEIVGIERIPPANESVTAGSITFRRQNETLIAEHDGTAIPLARYRLEKER